MRLKRSHFSKVVIALAVLILLAALPSAIRDTLETGRIYLFSPQFLEELPQRFIGPGRLRFIVQPLVAMVLGWRSGLNDAQTGQPAYLYGLIFGSENRGELLRSGLAAVRDLIAMGIVLDAVAQLLIYGQIHPGAALVIGPVLICLPYAISRALTNRVVVLMRQHPRK